MLMSPYQEAATVSIPMYFHCRMEGEEEQKLIRPQSITASTSGQFIVADNNRIKVFDCNLKFLSSFCATTAPEEIIKDVHVARDKVFVLTSYYRTIMDHRGGMASITYSSKVTVSDKGDKPQSFDDWPNFYWNFTDRERKPESLCVAEDAVCFS